MTSTGKNQSSLIKKKRVPNHKGGDWIKVGSIYFWVYRTTYIGREAFRFNVWEMVEVNIFGVWKTGWVGGDLI